MTNSEIAELLAREATSAQQPLERALRRAARRALLWPEEVAEMLEKGRSLTELAGIGPYLSKLITGWLESPPEIATPPPIRQNFITLPEARGLLSKDPSWIQRIKGDLQTHTRWSDGSGSLQEMANVAMQRGYEYLAITDHSKGLRIARGIDENQLGRQKAEIDTVNRSTPSSKRPFRLLRSIELNLSPDGAGDMDQDALRSLDLVLGCFHSALRRKEDQTERYLAALRNPSIHILGHPRGRIYNYRVGLTADWEQVFALAAELDKAVEVDCYPDRQDLSVDLLHKAKGAGCRISIGTDSHNPTELGFIEFGLAAVLLAGIDPMRILNFMSCNELTAWASSVACG